MMPKQKTTSEDKIKIRRAFIKLIKSIKTSVLLLMDRYCGISSRREIPEASKLNNTQMFVCFLYIYA